jgi:hypothetical protein
VVRVAAYSQRIVTQVIPPAARAAAGLHLERAGTPAVAPGSPHSHIPVVGPRGLITGADQARQFVADRVAEGSDYIKIIVGNPAPGRSAASGAAEPRSSRTTSSPRGGPDEPAPPAP